MDETGPDGTRTFSQNGMQTVKDPYTGKTYEVPRFSSTTTLSPAQQAIKDQQNTAGLNLSTLGANLSGTLKNKLTDNFSLDNEATETRLTDLGRKRLDPMFLQQDEDMRTRLSNQGIKAGSEAFDREMLKQSQYKNDAYNQLFLNGRAQASNEILTEDNQRINQIGALLSGGQVSQPNFASNVGIGAIPTTDNASIIGNYDNQRMKSWQESQGAMGSMLGGLGGLFAGGAKSAMSGMMMLSDERTKKDKEKIGETDDGMGIYNFKYKGTDTPQTGLMAQEVQKKKPHAVRKGRDGLLRVNYAEALR